MRQAKNNQGSALLTALFIMTLVAIVATAMTARLQLDIYRTQLVLNQDKLYLAAQAVSFWAIEELNDPKKHFNKLLKHGEVATYPANMQSIQKNVKIRGELYDLQAKFNLNNLLEKKRIFSFFHLLHAVMPKLSLTERNDLAEAVMDWIQDYDPSRGKEGYFAYYLAQKPPYYPSHQIMQSPSELRLVKGISAAYYLALEPYITALPQITPININTASKEVLMSLGNGISEEKINLLLEARATKPILKLSSINELIKKLDLPVQQLSTESEYFLSKAHASSGEQNLIVYTLIRRSQDSHKKLETKIIRVAINAF